LNVELDSKRLELLHELVPGATTIALLVNPDRPGVQAQLKRLEAAAHTIGWQIVVVNSGTESDLDTAFAGLAEQEVGALFVQTDAFLFSRRDQIIKLVLRPRTKRPRHRAAQNTEKIPPLHARPLAITRYAHPLALGEASYGSH
jgi:DNA integrity scanning protein DisA with diadenylate cyclase activity